MSEGRTRVRGTAPATVARAPRRALADSRSSRGSRCARFTPALPLAPTTPRLRFGPPLAPQGGLRCAARSRGVGGDGAGVLRDRTESQRQTSAARAGSGGREVGVGGFTHGTRKHAWRGHCGVGDGLKRVLRGRRPQPLWSGAPWPCRTTRLGTLRRERRRIAARESAAAAACSRVQGARCVATAYPKALGTSSRVRVIGITGARERDHAHSRTIPGSRGSS